MSTHYVIGAETDRIALETDSVQLQAHAQTLTRDQVSAVDRRRGNGMNGRLITSSQRLRRVLDDREEALATLLERPGGQQALPRRCGGKPKWLGGAGSTTKPVVRIPLKRGVPGEVLDIQLRDARSTTVERVLYRCLSISSWDSIESTPWDYSATWHAAQLLTARAVAPKRPKEVRVVSMPASSQGSTCRICGRRKLTRKEYNWRRQHGYAVWRCQHRRPSPSRRAGLIDAGGVIVALVACIVLLAKAGLR